MLNESRLIEIYNLYKKELYVYILRFTHSQETTEDIIQDCFERLIAYSKKYELVDGYIRSFLYKTAHNLCINYIKRRQKIVFVPIEEDSKKTDDDYISADTEFDELNSKIYSLIEQCDSVSQSIFIMKKELEMDIHEIATSIGISERTVRRKMNALIEYLAAALRDSGFI